MAREGRNKSIGLRIVAIIMIIVIALLGVLLIFIATNSNSNSSSRVSQFIQSFVGGRNKKTLAEEAERIIGLNPYEEDIDTTIYTTGTFATLETAMKEYCIDYVDTLRSVRTLLKDEQYLNLVTIENIEADGPSFTKSLSVLDELQTKATETIDRLKNMKEESALMGKIADIDLNAYFTDLYHEMMVDNIAARWMYTDAELDDALTNLTASLDSRRSVLEFLRAEKDNWEITEGKLAFSGEEQLEQYNALTAALN